MISFKLISALQEEIKTNRLQNKSVGFVPTMGALHNGHLSLIKTALEECDVVVCSVFVNPSQFNDKTDLARYPRTPDQDAELLLNAGCHILFMPEVEEMYPEEDKRNFEFGFLDKTLDGLHRPGHFNGVAQIVSKLFDAVMPDKAFFGMKDYQQVLIVKNLVKQLAYSIQIVACPTCREPDGLAMSSRNSLLSPAERIAASVIPALLRKADEYFKNGMPFDQIKFEITKEIDLVPLFKMDYFEIRDPNTLQNANSDASEVVFLIALFCGKTRLIDNWVSNKQLI